MSTSYYRLNDPVTHIRVTGEGSHVQLSIWVNHAMSGTLVLRREELRSFVAFLRKYEDDGDCPMRTHWGGSEVGSIVTENENNLPDEMIVISEYGDLLTVREVRARQGAKRKDGAPTELFGYEKEQRSG